MKNSKYFLIDVFRCIGCNTCSIACKMENGVPEEQNRLRILNPQQTTVFDKPNGNYPDLDMEWWPVMCQHCSDAPCVNDCPTYAIHKLENGMVEIDPEMCVGCQNCGQLCPYDAISFDNEIGTSDKCDMCQHRLEDELQPMCVEVCPTRAIHFIDEEKSTGEVSKITKDRTLHHLSEDANTEPTTCFVFRN